MPSGRYCRTVLFALSLSHGAFAAVDDSAWQAAIGLYQQHQLIEAQQAFETLAASDPDHAGVQAYLGRLAVQRNDAALAVRYLEKAAQLNPTDSRTQLWLGNAYGLNALKGGLFSKMSWANKCRAAYEKSVELDPASLKARTSLADFYLQAPAIVGGGTDKALAQAQAVKQLDAAQGRALIARIQVAARKFDLAFAEYDEALRTDPDDCAALYQIGRLALLSGQRLDDGLAASRRCLTLATTGGDPAPASVQFQIGEILLRTGDTAGARAAYEATLKLEPDFPQAITALKKI